MDPFQHDGTHGLGSRSPEEDGANYLRRLKELQGPAASEPAAGSIAPAAQIGPGRVERRRRPRYRCQGSVEFRAGESDVRVWGTVTDISRHGCYVEMTSTFPAGTDVDLGMEVQGIRVRARGAVCVTYAFLGMGIAFTEVEAEEEAKLEQLLSLLAKPRGPAGPASGAAEEGDAQKAVAAADPNALLDEIARFFALNRLLSREEFTRIAKLARHS